MNRKPVYKGHAREPVKVELMERWPLFTGPNDMNKKQLGNNSTDLFKQVVPT